MHENAAELYGERLGLVPALSVTGATSARSRSSSAPGGSSPGSDGREVGVVAEPDGATRGVRNRCPHSGGAALPRTVRERVGGRAGRLRADGRARAALPLARLGVRPRDGRVPGRADPAGRGLSGARRRRPRARACLGSQYAALHYAELHTVAYAILRKAVTHTNPFTFGALALDRSFTDREAEIRELVRDMQNGQDVLVYAPRRYGKSSLVLRAAQRAIRKGSSSATAT